MAIDRPLTVSFARIAAILVKLAAIVPLVLLWGITRAAIAGLTRSVVVNVWLNVVIRRDLRIPANELYPPRQLATMAAAYGAGFGVAWALQDLLVQPLGLAVALLGGTIAYVTTYVALGGPTEQDRKRFRALVARVRRRRATAVGPTPEGFLAAADGAVPPPTAPGSPPPERVSPNP